MDKNKIVNTRKNLYDSLTKNSHIKIINGRHKGKMGASFKGWKTKESQI